MKTVTLQPITMQAPNIEGIYAPSQILPLVTIGMDEFIDRWLISKRPIKVSFADNHVSNWTIKSAFGLGLSAWYIVAEGQL